MVLREMLLRDNSFENRKGQSVCRQLTQWNDT